MVLSANKSNIKTQTENRGCKMNWLQTVPVSFTTVVLEPNYFCINLSFIQLCSNSNILFHVIVIKQCKLGYQKVLFLLGFTVSIINTILKKSKML